MGLKRRRGQAERLSAQHLKGGGVVGIFGVDARVHDADIRSVANEVFLQLCERLPHLQFRIRHSIAKQEIHDRLNAIDSRLGVRLFVAGASIQPDGRVIEVLDLQGAWRVVLAGESKHQGNDIPNISAGRRTMVMERRSQYIMPAGNAIERVHKNIQEMKNYMLSERHFPYVVFLQGSNFATEPVIAKWPDGPEVCILPTDAGVNRIDRVTACNYGMEINKNYCKNIVVSHSAEKIMLQVASVYAQCELFSAEQIFTVLWDTAQTSLEVLANELPATPGPD
jgi:type II restriction enzyme